MVEVQGEKMVFDYASALKWQKLHNNNLPNTFSTNLAMYFPT